jgi:hypothetical protein
VRPEGSKRLYQLTLGGQKLGELESVAKGKTTYNGIKCYRFDEKLLLDFSPFGNDYKLRTENRRYVDSLGQYIGDDMELEVNDQPQKLQLTNKSGQISGYWEKENQKEPINISLGEILFAADNYMLDQIELYLAGFSLRTGNTVSDSFFVPQAMIKMPFRFEIEAFVKMPYGDLVDSAFVCHFDEPSDQIVYITRSGKIIKMIQPSQKIEAVLAEKPIDRARALKKPLSLAEFMKRTPFYLLYIFVAAVCSVPFLKRNYRKPDIFLAAILGIIVYFLIEFTQTPLQQWFISSYFIPGIRAGGSIYFYSIISSFISAATVEILKLIPILFLFTAWKNRSLEMSIIGLFVGLGFGLSESWASVANIAGTGAFSIIGWSIFERIFAFLFHMATGVLIGFALERSYKQMIIFLLATMVIHSGTIYLAVFVQRRIIDIAIMEIISAFIGLMVVLFAYLMMKKYRGIKSADNRPRIK